MKMNQLATGKFISRKRKEKNYTQEQLAEKLGVSNKTISKWETGKCMPDYSIIKNLCEELQITVAELIDGGEAGEKNIRLYDDEQIVDLLRRIQELEKQKNLVFGILLVVMGVLYRHFHIQLTVQILRTSFLEFCWEYQLLK